MKKTALIALALLLAPAWSKADVETSGSSGVGGRWLNILNNPRTAGMGGAGAALARGAGSLGANPAGLADGQQDLETSHLAWDEDISLQRLAYSFPLGSTALGLRVDYVNLGAVEAFQIVGGSPVVAEALHPHAGTFGAAVAVPLGLGVQAGLELKGLFQDLGEGNGFSAASDLGLRWSQGATGAAFGAALLNAGAELQGSRLPLKAVFGGAWTQALGPGADLRAAADLHFSPESDEAAALSVGGEYSVKGLAEFRAGYLLAPEGSPAGPSAGLSVSLGRWLNADYAFNSLGGQPSNQVGLRASWGGALAASEAAPPAATPVVPAPALTPEAAAQAASPTAADLSTQVATTIDKLLNAVDAKDAAATQSLTESMVSLAPSLRAQMAETVKAQGVAPSVFDGEFQRAEAYLRTMTRLQRDNAYGWMALGTVLWFQGREAEALECYQKSYLLDPTQAFLAKRIQQLGGAVPQP